MHISLITLFLLTIIKFLVFGNVLKNNTYPLSVSAERTIQALEIVKYAKENKATHIAHGSTGAGNDQVRFELSAYALNPIIMNNSATPYTRITKKTETGVCQSKRDYFSSKLEAKWIHKQMPSQIAS